MAAENKPLEMSVLKRVKELLAEVDARTAARHITTGDCLVGRHMEVRNHLDLELMTVSDCFQVARILGVTSETQRMMGVSSGLELLTLPHGHQLRLDLLERYGTDPSHPEPVCRPGWSDRRTPDVSSGSSPCPS